MAGGDEIAHGIGQIELALGVGGLQPVERRPEQVAPGRRRSRSSPRRSRAAPAMRPRASTIDFEVAAGVADDPAVAPDVVGTNDSTVAPAACERWVASSAWSSSVVSSGVSPERMSTSSAPASCLLGAPHGIPGPERAAPAPRPSARRSRSAVSGETTTTSGVRLERPGSLDDPVDHAAAQDRMQVLGRGRAHACPPASGHDDGCELGAGFGHGRHVGWGARIRTWDHGTKARCLTTWPRPSESGRRVYPEARSSRSHLEPPAAAIGARCQRRSSSSSASATAARTTIPTSARIPATTSPTGTSTTMSWDTAAIQVPARIPGEP